MPPPDAPGLIGTLHDLLEDDPRRLGIPSLARRPQRIGGHLDPLGTSPRPTPCLPSAGSRSGSPGSIGAPPVVLGDDPQPAGLTSSSSPPGEPKE